MFLVVPSGAPQNVSVAAINPYTASVSWSTPSLEVQNGIIRNYTIVVTDVSNETILHVKQSATTLIIYNLKPINEYFVHIAAVTIDIGPFSEPVSILMPESSK